MKYPNILVSVRTPKPRSRPAFSSLDQRPHKRFLALAISLFVCAAHAQDSSPFAPMPSLEHAPALPTLPDPHALLSTNWNMGFTLGAGFGVSDMGSAESHHLTAATLHVGKLLESGRPLLRHVELAGELWSGAQFHPDSAYLVGLTPVARYHFLPGSRLDPFIDGGAGVTATDIGRPDLSTTFEFNLQAGVGFHWVLRKNLALTFDGRYIHLSNAGIDQPNHGVNSFLFSSGLTWFF